MFRLNASQELTPAVITKLIQAHKLDIGRLQTLENYYDGKTAITTRVMEDTTKPNNKIVNPYSKYITDTMVGYFMGKPVRYVSDVVDMDAVVVALSSNDEQDENAGLAMDASIYGVAYEMLYLNELGEPKFKKINPKEVIVIVDDTLAEELLYVIRYYETLDIVTDKKGVTIEVYSRDTITTYTANEQATSMEMVAEPFAHYFGAVPFIEYKNNDYLKGDFEPVMSLIDAYDKVSSDGINDFESFVNSYLVLKGMTADSEDIVAMREKRTLLLDMDADASWLTKNASESQSENLLANTEANIHKFSHCPNMSDSNFAGNSSGVAMRYKIMGTEDIALIKERKFKKALQRRLALLATILNLKGGAINWQDIDIIFTRNLPVSLSEDLDAIIKLSGIISQKTQLSQIPFVEDVDAEMLLVQEEKDAQPDFYTAPIVTGDSEVV